MGPKQAWRVLTLVIMLLTAVSTVVLISLGYDAYPVLFLALVTVLVYFYVLYKRYHVEVVPGSDIMLFDDPDDLRILAGIYGLDGKGDTEELRARLIAFARSNKEKAFTWVAPRAVVAFGSVFELADGATPCTELQRPSAKNLVGGRTRSPSRRANIRACPVCDAAVESSGSICAECGADIEFYTVLSESKVGKRLISRKNVAVRRKLRYDVPTLGEDR